MHPAVVLAVLIGLVLTAYVVVGSAVRYQKGMRQCPDMLPNYPLWRRLALLVHRLVMYVLTCGRYRAPPERVVAVLPQRPVEFRRGQAFHQLPDADDLDDDDSFANDPIPSVQIRY